MAAFRDVPSPDWVFLGVGSDEVIDLLIRISCVPGTDKILITPPTYGMYAVCAEISDVAVVRCPLTGGDDPFNLQIDNVRLSQA
jgi:histidinol-phosphate aminotransferase